MAVTRKYLAAGEAFAVLFSYPGGDYRATLDTLLHWKGLERDLRDDLERFAAALADLKDWELEELYTATFDMNPGQCLELGWHLYGERYQRGEFLVRLRRELQRHGIAETVELPDHLSHCLRLLARLTPQEAAEFVAETCRPAVERIAGNLPADNAYAGAVAALGRYFQRINMIDRVEQ